MAVAGALLATAWLSLETDREGLLEVGKLLGLRSRTRPRISPLEALARLARAVHRRGDRRSERVPRQRAHRHAPLVGARLLGPRALEAAPTASGTCTRRERPSIASSTPSWPASLLLSIFAFTATVSLLIGDSSTALGRPRARRWGRLPGDRRDGLGPVDAAADGCLRPRRAARLALSVAGRGETVAKAGPSARPRCPCRCRRRRSIDVWGASRRRRSSTGGVGTSTTRSTSRSTVRYVWSSNYDGIDFPKEETVVLRIRAPKRVGVLAGDDARRVHGLRVGGEAEGDRARAGPFSFPGYPWQRIESQFGAGAVRSVVAAPFDPLLA